MRKKIFFFLALIKISLVQVVFAQTENVKKADANYFDEKAAYEQAKEKGIQTSDIKGYVQFLKNDFSSKKALEKQVHKHTPYEGGSSGIQETVIYLEPNKPMSLGCPNMGFEQYNFNGWTGGKGTVSIGAVGGNPIYTSTGTAIINSAGDNVSVLNTINYQTILTIPPTNNTYPICSGFDSLAVRSVGTTTISDIPFISPFSFDPISVRLNSANTNYRAARLKYITTTSSTNQRLSFSYAVILNDPSTHTAQESPYFKVEVKNESTGIVLPGCSSDDFNPKTASAADSLKTSVLQIWGDNIKYRKWMYYSVDLSSLPAGTSVSINFEVGGCTQGGHTGYAYVDAECGGIGTPYANMCSGSTFATLVAPTGFNSYQWADGSGIIAGATNDTLIVPSAIPGATYTINLISPGGCFLTQTVSIALTTVNIINLNSTSSCAGGNSGSASVSASGSNGVYTYTWTAVPSGSIVSNSQTATGLAPGSYSVLVASTTCGQASANLSVGVSPPFFFSQSKSFCGNSAFISQPGGSNYIWYHNSALVPAPDGINDTMYIATALVGDLYTVVYDNAQGCRDSIAYTLNQIAGGNVYFSNINNVCPNDSNGSVVLNLNTPFSAPYNYFVTGPTNSVVVTNTTTSATSITISPLAPGTYTSVINDGVCIYNNTVTISTIQTNFTVTPTHSVLCFPEEVVLNLEFGETAPSSCGLSTSTGCNSPNIIQVGTSTTNGSSNNYSPYGGLWESQKNQFIFRASELLAAGITPGKITSLALNVTNTNGNATTFANFTIKLKCVSYNVLNTSTMDNAGLIQVFNPTTINATTGWNTYNFSQAYDWDGTTNLLVDICFFNPAWDGNLSVEYSSPGYTASKYVNADNIDQCPLSTVDGSGIQRPNIRFGNCGASSPSSYTVDVSSNGTITATYNNDSIRVAPTFTSPPTGTGSVVYTISVTNPIGGCVATKTVEILYPPLTTTITAAITNSLICEGDTTTLSATGASTYNWFYQQGPGGPLFQISTSSSVNVTPPSIGTNTYVVTGYAPCASGTTDTKTITVNVTPKANLLITPLQDVTKCLNKDFVFNTGVGSATPGNPGTPYSYFWTTLPGNIPAPGVNSTSSYTVTDNNTTTLVFTVDGVCANSTNDTVIVTNFIDDLSISITNSITTCPNKPLLLNSITSGGHPLYNYAWTINSNTISNTPDLNYTSPSTGGTYSVEVTVIDSCGYQNSDIEVIYVLPNTLNVSIIDSVSLCGNSPFQLNSFSSGGYPDYSYQWYIIPNTNSISNTAGLSYTTPPTEGLYTIQVVISDSCGYQQSDFQVINVLPPCQVEIPNIITPNGDNINDYFIVNNLEYHTNTRITIFDRWGRKVYENPNYNNEWKADDVGDGTYFYVIEVPEDKSYSGFITVFKDK